MIYLLNIFVLTLLSVFSLSVLPHIRLFGVVPLMVPFFLITLTYFRKGFEPFILAAFTGFFFDLFSSYPFGFYLSFFLFLAVIVKSTFQEGMRSLSFWYYCLFSFLALLIFYGSQIGFLYFQGASLSAQIYKPLLSGLIVNAVCVILLYVFSGWYFDRLNSFEDALKRR